MFGLEILEVGIGLALTYFLLATICSGIFEIIAWFFNIRAQHLKKALELLLSDPDSRKIIKQVYQNDLISRNKLGQKRMPSWIEGKTFATALIQAMHSLDQRGKTASVMTFEEIKAQILAADMNPRLKAMVEKGATDMESLVQKISDWYNDAMEDVTHWYRRRAQYWVIGFAIAITVITNVDTIRLGSAFWHDNELREATVQMAKEVMSDATLDPTGKNDPFRKPVQAPAQPAPQPAPQPADSADSTHAPAPVPADTQTSAGQGLNVAALDSLIGVVQTSVEKAESLPIGTVTWSRQMAQFRQTQPTGKDWTIWWLMKLFGLAMTIGAVSMGAPFWYNQLRSLLNFMSRNTQNSNSPAAPPVNVNVTVTPPANSTVTEAEEDEKTEG